MAYPLNLSYYTKLNCRVTIEAEAEPSQVARTSPAYHIEVSAGTRAPQHASSTRLTAENQSLLSIAYSNPGPRLRGPLEPESLACPAPLTSTPMSQPIKDINISWIVSLYELTVDEGSLQAKYREHSS